jgi:hypothetical protein
VLSLWALGQDEYCWLKISARTRPSIKTFWLSSNQSPLLAAHDAQTINRADERGANSYLVKSANPDEVNRWILFVKQYWLTFNQSSNRLI